eukprot:SAG11_NODE_135_length_15131_cov_9.906599_11_plen_192_part_00
MEIKNIVKEVLESKGTAPGSMHTVAQPAQAQEVINLCETDDEDKAAPSAEGASDGSTSAPIAARSALVQCSSQERIRIKFEANRKRCGDTTSVMEYDPDCSIIEQSSPASTLLRTRASLPTTPFDSPAAQDADVVVTAAADPTADFPHARHNCRHKTFVPVAHVPTACNKAPAAAQAQNVQHCDFCYCYVR